MRLAPRDFCRKAAGRKDGEEWRRAGASILAVSRTFVADGEATRGCPLICRTTTVHLLVLPCAMSYRYAGYGRLDPGYITDDTASSGAEGAGSD